MCSKSEDHSLPALLSDWRRLANWDAAAESLALLLACLLTLALTDLPAVSFCVNAILDLLPLFSVGRWTGKLGNEPREFIAIFAPRENCATSRTSCWVGGY